MQILKTVGSIFLGVVYIILLPVIFVGYIIVFAIYIVGVFSLIVITAASCGIYEGICEIKEFLKKNSKNAIIKP